MYTQTHKHTDVTRTFLLYITTQAVYSVTSQPHLSLSLIKNVCLDDTVVSLTKCDHVICPNISFLAWHIKYKQFCISFIRRIYELQLQLKSEMYFPDIIIPKNLLFTIKQN